MGQFGTGEAAQLEAARALGGSSHREIDTKSSRACCSFMYMGSKVLVQKHVSKHHRAQDLIPKALSNPAFLRRDHPVSYVLLINLKSVSSTPPSADCWEERMTLHSEVARHLEETQTRQTTLQTLQSPSTRSLCTQQSFQEGTVMPLSMTALPSRQASQGRKGHKLHGRRPASGRV